jgi:ferrous iron transport protein A
MEAKGMSENVRLTDLKRGQKAVIAKLAAYDDMRRRLQDIGLIEGTTVECLGKSPLGDPTAFLIRGAVIALRSEDSGRVLIQSNGEDKAKRRYGEEMVAANLSLEEKVWD